MKLILLNLLRLKPFNEADDAKKAGSIYASSTLLTLLIVCSAGASIVSLIMAITNHPYVLNILCIAVGLSAITSGFEWTSGLKGRAKNQLFVCVFMSVAILIIRN